MSNDETVHIVAESARAITRMMVQVSHLLSAPHVNHDRLVDLVCSLNALLIPKAWIGIDDVDMVHLTVLAREDNDDSVRTYVMPRPAILMHHAHFIWELSVLDNTMKCVKSRDETTARVGEIHHVKRAVQPAVG